MKPALVSVEDAAKVCGVQPRTIRGWLTSGRISNHDGMVDANELDFARSRARIRLSRWL